MLGEGVGEDQGRDPLRPSGVHRDRNDAAEREAADVGPLEPELRHGGETGRCIIVAGHALDGRSAVAVARVIERYRAALGAEKFELRTPHRLVRADAVKEDDRRRGPDAHVVAAKGNSRCGRYAAHARTLTTCATSRNKFSMTRHAAVATKRACPE